MDYNDPRLSAAVIRFQQTLQASERASSAQLRSYQNGLLTRLVRHARETVPFYRNTLSCLFRGDDIDLSRWDEVPILTRADIAAQGDGLFCQAMPSEAGRIYRGTTTGTTGKPLQIIFNSLNMAAAHAALARTARWWGVDTASSMAKVVIHLDGTDLSYPDGRDTRGWCLSNPDSQLYELDMLTPVEHQIEWLLRKKPTYLATSPVNATALAHAITDAQVRELGLRTILAYGETVLPLARRVVPERFRVPLIGIYSCQEVGYIATQCPHTTNYHIMADNVLVEIMREDGTAADPGELGLVVLTGFYNYAMPFIRYAIGDVATAGPDVCSCGMTLPVITRVEGRTRHSFVFEDGKRIWPRMGNFDPSPYVSCREFQLIQLDYQTLEFRYVPADDQPPNAQGLQTYVQHIFHPTVRVQIASVRSLDKGPGGKLTPYLSMVE